MKYNTLVLSLMKTLHCNVGNICIPCSSIVSPKQDIFLYIYLHKINEIMMADYDVI